MAKRLTKTERAAIATERAKRKAKPFTIENVAGGDTPQRRYLLSLSPFTIALCSKRAGKSYANMVLLALTAMASSNVTCLYLGLTQKAVDYQIVRKLWDPLVRKYALPFTPVNSDGVATCTTTNSIVRFGSVDDTSNILQYMGDTLAGGIVIIDEAQDIAVKVLEPLVEEIIMPSLSDTTDEHPIAGRLVLSGTVPQTPHGYFYKKYVEENGWEKHNWNRLQNLFLRNQEAELEKVLALLQVTRSDTRIRRLWFGDVTAFDDSETAYRYKSERSTYVPAKISHREIGPFHCSFADAPDLDRFVVGIDPAHRKDRFGLVCMGWNSKKRDRFVQVAECVTEPGADPLESEWLAIVIELKRLYRGIGRYIYDPGSTGGVLDSLYHSHGIIIEPAVKGPGSVKRRVDRLADLLFRGKAVVIRGGHLDNDLQVAKWDTNALMKGEWKLDKSHGSPDVSDAASYAVLDTFTELGAQREAAGKMTEAQYWAEQNKQHIEQMWRDANRPDPKPKPGSMFWRRPPV